MLKVILIVLYGQFLYILLSHETCHLPFQGELNEDHASCSLIKHYPQPRAKVLVFCSYSKKKNKNKTKKDPFRLSASFCVFSQQTEGLQA